MNIHEGLNGLRANKSSKVFLPLYQSAIFSGVRKVLVMEEGYNVHQQHLTSQPQLK